MYLQPLLTSIELFLFTSFLAFISTNVTIDQQHIDTYQFRVNFELKSDSIWQAPSRGEQTQVYLVLEMKNLGNDPVCFPIMDKFNVSLQYPDGSELMMDGGQDVLIPGELISDPVPSGEKYLLEVNAQLGWGPDNELQLTLKDGFGSIWWIGPLKAATYKLIMQYESQQKDQKDIPNLWFGQANINHVSIKIVY